MTIRDLNTCNNCGHTWYPRGSYLSRKCPNCRNQDSVSFANSGSDESSGCLGLIALLIGILIVAGVIVTLTYFSYYFNVCLEGIFGILTKFTTPHLSWAIMGFFIVGILHFAFIQTPKVAVHNPGFASVLQKSSMFVSIFFILGLILSMNYSYKNKESGKQLVNSKITSSEGIIVSSTDSALSLERKYKGNVVRIKYLLEKPLNIQVGDRVRVKYSMRDGKRVISEVEKIEAPVSKVPPKSSEKISVVNNYSESSVPTRVENLAPAPATKSPEERPYENDQTRVMTGQ